MSKFQFFLLVGAAGVVAGVLLTLVDAYVIPTIRRQTMAAAA